MWNRSMLIDQSGPAISHRAPRASCREQIARLNQSYDKERNLQSSEEEYPMRSGLSKGPLFRRSLVALKPAHSSRLLPP